MAGTDGRLSEVGSMDNYLQSSAVSRRHYALTHRVENAASVQDADDALWAEMDRIRAKAANGLTDAYDELVILMYCHTAAAARPVTASDLEFALSPAVNLAATGRAVKHRRIGLTFCALFMPLDHPLQLMLVNTLRKEIESDELQRIVLATDFITACPSEFLGPAVVPRLEVLLGHKSQNIRRRAVFALRALDSIFNESHAELPHPNDTHLSQHKPTIMRRLTRAAREDHSGMLTSQEIIPAIAALLEKTITSAVKGKSKSHQPSRSPWLVSSLVHTLECAVTAGKQAATESVSKDLAKLAIRTIRVFSDKPASPQVLQSFRLLGALPTSLVHSLLQAQDQTPQASTSSISTPPPAKPKVRHPVGFIRPLLVSRDPNERWVGLVCLKALHPSLWAGVPLEGAQETIPPVLDEWEVGVIMKGLSDPDQTLRRLTMRVLDAVDPQLLHVFLEQLITPPPSASSAKQSPGEALEVVSFLYANDGSKFGQGVGRIFDKHAEVNRVDEKLVEGVVSVVHESNQAFRASFASSMLQRITKSRHTSLFSPLSSGALPDGDQQDAGKISADPTTVLLFATTANDLAAGVKQALNSLLDMLDGRGAGMQEVLLLAALRLVPKLEKPEEIEAARARVETFSQKPDVGRHIRRRCELFIKYANDQNVLRRIAEETQASSLPEFLQALLSNGPSVNAQPTPKQALPLAQSPKATAARSVISPAFSTISLSNTPALRYDPYAPPQPPARRTRPHADSLHHRGSGDSSTSLDSPFVREGEVLAGEMVLQAADERNRAKGKGKANEASSHLRLDTEGTPKKTTSPNPNADLITLSAVESPFREETEFGTLNMSSSIIAGAMGPTSDSTTISSPRFYTAAMTSPRLAGSDLAPVDADAIWNSFDVLEGDATLGKQTLRGWCDKAPESVAGVLREMGLGFLTQKVAVEEGSKPGKGQEVFAYIPSPSESPDSEVARAVIRLRPAEDGSCLWMLRCGEWDLRVKIRKALDGETA